MDHSYKSVDYLLFDNKIQLSKSYDIESTMSMYTDNFHEDTPQYIVKKLFLIAFCLVMVIVSIFTLIKMI